LIPTVTDMFNHISRSQIFVLDQDVAREFYVDTLGLEVATDQDLGFMRWLTVRVPGDVDREILLERPGPPAMDESTAEQVRELVSKGAMGGWLCLTTDDPYGTFETLRSRGVDITDEPSPKPYGVDFGIRDPFGNAIRIGKIDPT
jgi:catechol 2,3-dioxygenase-like lactoylglutathione lyase family enzyme